MNSIYINNYRGFSDTFLDVKKVNFLVGENSTGKTSLIRIFNLLSSPIEFLGPYNYIQRELGSFSEIVSDSGGTEVELGVSFANIELDNSDKKETVYLIIKISGKKSIPYVSEFSVYSSKGILIFYKPCFGKIKYYFDNKYKISLDSDYAVFMELKNIRNNYSNKLKNIPRMPSPLNEKISFPMVFSLMSKCEMELPIFLIGDKIIDIAPIRSCPQKTYDGISAERKSDGSHVPYLLKTILESTTKATRPVIEKLTDFGISSGLFKKINFAQYGKSADAPFALTIDVGAMRRIDDVGYGVSQVLPVLADIFSVKKEALFSIQQPEIHLHPKAQAALGDVFFMEAFDSKKIFFIETHSDYLIDRFRLSFKKREIDEKFSQIIFTQRIDNINRASMIPIQPDGNYPENQPDAFRDFFLTEQINLLSL